MSTIYKNASAVHAPMTLIPYAPLNRIMLSNGAKRVSAPSVAALADLLAARGTAIATRAIAFARHAGRKTVHAADVRMALKP